MIDRETEVLSKCTELLTEVDDNARFRIVKYLIERFGIMPNSTEGNNKNNFVNQSPQFVINANAHSFDYTEETNIKEEYPTLKQVVLKNMPKSEAEWVLCYAFYASNYGNDSFFKDSILDKYKESNRDTKIRLGNLVNNIHSCIKKDWIKDINKNEYTINDCGIVYAKEILKGNSTSKEIKRIKRTKKSNSNSENNQ